MKYDVIFYKWGKKSFVEENQEKDYCDEILTKLQGNKKYKDGILLVTQSEKPHKDSVFYLTLNDNDLRANLKEWLNVQPFASILIPNLTFRALQAFKYLQSSGYGFSQGFRIEIGIRNIEKIKI